MTRANAPPLSRSKVWKRPNRSSVAWSVVPEVTPTVTAIRNRSAIRFEFLLPLDEYRGTEFSLVIDGADFHEVFVAMLRAGIKRRRWHEWGVNGRAPVAMLGVGRGG